MVRQHVADEKAQIFGLPIGKRGVKRAESEIRVFRQHRPTYHPMKKVSELAAISLADLETNQAVLQKLFEEHKSAEEGRVFPRAMS
jgi:hypothetical protein